MSRASGWSSSANTVPVGRSDEAIKSGGFSTPPPSELPPLGVPLFNAAPLDSTSKHARKIYIGNLPPSATSESMIAQFFNQTLVTLLPNKPPGDSIVGTYLNVQKRFAFIENRSIEETTFTLGLDGIQMDDYALKLRRPQDYNAQLAQQQLSQEMRLKGGISSLRGAWNPMQQQQVVGDPLAVATTAPGIVSTSVEDGPNKVFIGGLPHHMGEHEVKELLSSYGPLKAFHLVKDRELDRSKGFAFCEWRDATVTDIACHALNGMKVGERCLNVRRAVPHAAHRGVAGMLTGDPTQLALTYLPPLDQPIKPIPPAQKGVPPLNIPEIAPYFRKESTQGSRCLAVRIGDMDVEAIQKKVEEVKSIASQIGRVRNAQFHHSEGGRILVEFSTPEEASIAQKYLNGDCSLTEMVFDMRKDCLNRILHEVDMLSRLDPNTRQIYNDKEQQKIKEIKLKREALLKENRP